MKKTISGVTFALVTVIAVSACTTRETRIVQPVVAPAAAGTTVVVPDRNPDIIVDVD